LRTLLLLFAFQLPLASMGQFELQPAKSCSTQLYLTAFLSVDQPVVTLSSSWNDYLLKMEKRHNSTRNEKEFLRYVFAKTHQVYLKKFVEYAHFNSLFSNGSYNCLTGTILYSIILNHFKIEHQVIETNYHIFILAKTAQGNVLLEVTDPYNGFIDCSLEIESRISLYKNNALLTSNGGAQPYYKFNFDLYKPVTLEELRGLLYYNKAIEVFNQQKIEESIHYLTKVVELYSSTRIEEFSQILILSLRKSSMNEQRKEDYLKKIFELQRRTLGTMAMVH
jgi:hypothetical protein